MFWRNGTGAAVVGLLLVMGVHTVPGGQHGGDRRRVYMEQVVIESRTALRPPGQPGIPPASGSLTR